MTAYDFPGSIENIYNSEQHTLVIYHKGVGKELAMQFDRNSREGRLEIEKLKKKFIAVFDSDYNLLINDLATPKGVISTTVLTSNGEILALKNQDYFGIEEDHVIYYKMKLLGQNRE